MTSLSLSSSANSATVSASTINLVAKKQNELQASTSKLFPYISLIQRSSVLPKFIHHIVYLFIFLQSVAISLWLQININYDDEIQSQLQKYFSYVLLFTPIDNTDYNSYLGIIIFFACLAIVAGLFIFIPILVYEKSKKVVKWILWLQDFMLNCIAPLITIPLFGHFGVGIVQSFNNHSSDKEYIILLIISIVALMVILPCVILSFIFSGNTVFFLASSYVVTNHRYVLIYLIGQGIFLAFSNVSSILGKELEFAEIILHIIFSILMLVGLFFMTPFLFRWVNYVVGGILIGSVIGDIVSFFVQELEYRILVIVAGTIIFSIVIKFVFDFNANRIIHSEIKFESASNTDEPPPKNEESNKGKEISERFVGLMIQFTLLYQDDIFLSGALFNKLTSKIKATESRLQIAKYTCFFHELQPTFTAQIATLRTATDLSFSQKFLLYQLGVVETGRQPLSSVPELNELRQETQEISASIRAAWYHLHSQASKQQHKVLENGKKIQTNLSFSSFEKLAYDISLVNNHWEEILNKYPKNALVAENYSRFLLECLCDFEKCAEWHYRALQLQNGKSFDYDKATIHFLRLFPKYAKKMVSQVLLASIDDLDIKTSEEMLGNAISMNVNPNDNISNATNSNRMSPKLCLEYQKAAQNHSNFLQQFMIFLVGFRFVFIVAYSIVILALFINMFDSRQISMQFINDISNICKSIEMSEISILFQGIKEYGNMPTYQDENQIIYQDEVSRYLDSQTLINFSNSFFDTSFNYSKMGINSLDEFIAQLNENSALGNNMQIFIDKLNDKENDMSIYFQSDNDSSFSVRDSDESIHSVIVFYLTESLILSTTQLSQSSMNNWIQEKDIYEISNASAQILNAIEPLMQSVIDNDAQDISDNKRMHLIIAISVAAFIFLFFIILYSICYACLRHQITFFVDTCKYLPHSAINRASSPISIDPSSSQYQYQISNNNNTSNNGNSQIAFASFDSKRIISAVIFVIEITITLISLVCVFVFYIQVVQQHDFFTNTNSLFKQSCIRLLYSMKIFSDFLKFNLLDCNSGTADLNSYQAIYDQTISVFTESHEACIRGDYGSGNVYNTIESLRKVSSCPAEWSSDYTEHESYACQALDSAIANFIELARLMKPYICTSSIIKTDTFLKPFHFLNNHLYFMMNEINSLIIQLGNENSANFNDSVKYIEICVIILSFLMILISIFHQFIITDTYSALMSFLLRIPPIESVKNEKLMDILLGHKNIITSRRRAKMTTSEQIVKNSNYPIVFVTSDLTIENVNQSFIVYFGYDISQVIGQPITQFIKTVDQEQYQDEEFDFGAQIMKLKDIKEYEINFIKENKSQIKCEMTVIPVKQTDNKYNHVNNENDNEEDDFSIGYYGIILRDLSLFISKQKQCDDLKAANDILAENIVPKIYESVNDTLKYENGVVLSIKFINYGVNLTPSAFIQQREMFFSQFDELLNERPLLTRVGISNGEFTVLGVTQSIKKQKSSVLSPLNSQQTSSHANINLLSISINDIIQDCFEFAMKAASLFAETDSTFIGSFVMGIDVGKVIMFIIDDGKRNTNIISGAASKKARALMQRSGDGEVTLSESVYNCVAKFDYNFDKIIDSNNEVCYVIKPIPMDMSARSANTT